jgi:hypothetical protein
MNVAARNFSLCLFFLVMGLALFSGYLPPAEAKTYVGSDACKDCHEDEYGKFMKYAKKAHSYDHIIRMQKGLTEGEFKECLGCHTTGYGQPSGFVSAEATPNLKNLGCETCHGPGSDHLLSAASKDIEGKLKSTICEKCHIEARSKAFNFKPMTHGGAH